MMQAIKNAEEPINVNPPMPKTKFAPGRSKERVVINRVKVKTGIAQIKNL